MDVVDGLNFPLLLVGLAALAALGASHFTHRFLLPAPALFLGIGVLANAASPDVRESMDMTIVARVGTIALVFILFDGGFNIGIRRLRRSLGPINALGIPGTLVTAIVVAAGCHYVFSLSWASSSLIGVALAPTDPAAVFSILGRLNVRGRSRTIIEGESGANDPVSIALMAAVIAYLNEGVSASHVVLQFGLQLVVGVFVGMVLGYVIAWSLKKLPLNPESLLPIAVVGSAFLAFGVAAELGGSGFLAALIAGVYVGDRFDTHQTVSGFSSVCAGLSEILVFTLLGLSIDLNSVGDELLLGVGVFALLTFVARPAVVASTLALTRLDRKEKILIGWGGLKGAVPILLAAFALIADVENGERVYAIVFVAVACSIIVQGTTIPALVRGMSMQDD